MVIKEDQVRNNLVGSRILGIMNLGWFDECYRESSLRILTIEFENRDLEMNIVRIEVRLPQGNDSWERVEHVRSNVDLENRMVRM